MKILFVTDLETSTSLKLQHVHVARKGFSNYKKFRDEVKDTCPDIIHLISVKKNTLGIYAGIAKILRIPVVETLQNPFFNSYWYIAKKIAARFFLTHTICTSKFDLWNVDRLHLARKSKRSLIYSGLKKAHTELLKKDAARTEIYKKIGTTFTKKIRIVGVIADLQDVHNGVEHVIDSAYLADKYKNLTNTIFMILLRNNASQDLRNQIEELNVQGICILVEHVEYPELLIHAFDILVSPRTASGDLHMMLEVLQQKIPAIVTLVGDMEEIAMYMAATPVPPQSAKYLTEAIMHVIKNPSKKEYVFPIKYSHEQGVLMLKDVYRKVHKKSL